jgi:predicted nucleic acid-binding protein
MVQGRTLAHSIAAPQGPRAEREAQRRCLDREVTDRSMIHGPRQVTDAYLLALATQQGCRFVTFDQAISLSSVTSATKTT